MNQTTSRVKRSALAALLVSFGYGAQAQADQPVTAAAPTPVMVIKAQRVFDGMSGYLGTGIEVVVQGERIVSVGTEATLPAGARIIDLGDVTLMPGFIDAHAHLTLESRKNYYLGFYQDIFRFPPEQSHYAAGFARKTLEAGFTTVRNVGAADHVDVGLRNAIDAGIIVGPRILTAGHAVGSTGSHCDSAPFPPDRVKAPGPLEGVCNGPDQCREAVRQQLKYGADVIKICASGGVLSPTDPVDVPQLTPAELQASVSEAHAWKRKVAAHAHGDTAARLAIEAGVDSIEHGSFLTEETLRLMKRKGTYLVPTRSAIHWVTRMIDTFPPKIAEKARAAAAAHGDMFRTALRIGVPIAFGTDAGVFPHGMNAMEFRLMTELGMSPADALLTSARGSARLLGIEADTGTLEAGKFADLVAVPGDAIANIESTEHPLFVMQRGRVVLERGPKAQDPASGLHSR
ncbi:MAG: amidohydrolase family protein [Proteobacteria bacterium]|nr:amidohydrolase family protein [Pseudomonadota bacterium]